MRVILYFEVPDILQLCQTGDATYGRMSSDATILSCFVYAGLECVSACEYAAWRKTARYPPAPGRHRKNDEITHCSKERKQTIIPIKKRAHVYTSKYHIRGDVTLSTHYIIINVRASSTINTINISTAVRRATISMGYVRMTYTSRIKIRFYTFDELPIHTYTSTRRATDGIIVKVDYLPYLIYTSQYYFNKPGSYLVVPFFRAIESVQQAIGSQIDRTSIIMIYTTWKSTASPGQP